MEDLLGQGNGLTEQKTFFVSMGHEELVNRFCSVYILDFSKALAVILSPGYVKFQVQMRSSGATF